MKIVPKGWGYEKWVVNKEQYCGKVLVFDQGKKCSWHYHKVKDETFYLQSGFLLVLHSTGDDIEVAEKTYLLPGDSFYAPVGLRHQMIAMENSELIEFSTQHFDEDSIKITPGD